MMSTLSKKERLRAQFRQAAKTEDVVESLNLRSPDVRLLKAYRLEPTSTKIWGSPKHFGRVLQVVAKKESWDSLTERQQKDLVNGARLDFKTLSVVAGPKVRMTRQLQRAIFPQMNREELVNFNDETPFADMLEYVMEHPGNHMKLMEADVEIEVNQSPSVYWSMEGEIWNLRNTELPVHLNPNSMLASRQGYSLMSSFGPTIHRLLKIEAGMYGTLEESQQMKYKRGRVPEFLITKDHLYVEPELEGTPPSEEKTWRDEQLSQSVEWTWDRTDEGLGKAEIEMYFKAVVPEVEYRHNAVVHFLGDSKGWDNATQRQEFIMKDKEMIKEINNGRVPLSKYIHDEMEYDENGDYVKRQVILHINIEVTRAEKLASPKPDNDEFTGIHPTYHHDLGIGPCKESWSKEESALMFRMQGGIDHVLPSVEYKLIIDKYGGDGIALLLQDKYLRQRDRRVAMMSPTQKEKDDWEFTHLIGDPKLLIHYVRAYWRPRGGGLHSRAFTHPTQDASHPLRLEGERDTRRDTSTAGQPVDEEESSVDDSVAEAVSRLHQPGMEDIPDDMSIDEEDQEGGVEANAPFGNNEA